MHLQKKVNCVYKYYVCFPYLGESVEVVETVAAVPTQLGVVADVEGVAPSLVTGLKFDGGEVEEAEDPRGRVVVN